MRRKVLPIILIFLLLFTAALAVACQSKSHRVEFYVDGELRFYYNIADGAYFDDFPPVPEKEGKIGKWDIDELDEIHSDIRINAIYTDAFYSITFKVNGEVFKVINVNTGSTLNDVPLVPEKKGYVGEWSIEDFALVNRSITVNAVYKRAQAVISFYDGTQLLFTRNVDEGGALTEIPDVPEKSGKKLSTRWIESDGKVANFSRIESNIDVYAYYFVTVTLSGCADEGEAEYDIGAEIADFESGEKNGYDFAGWYYDKDFRKKITFPCSFDENATVYCRWLKSGGDTDLFTFENGKVTGYIGSKSEAIVPYKYESGGQPVIVTAIADYAFEDNDKLTKITLPSTVTEIGNGAFRGCLPLTTVEFSDGTQLEKIGAEAFRGCTELKGFEFSEFLTQIGERAFAFCVEAENYVGLGNTSVTEIPDRVFYRNENVRRFSVPQSVTSVGAEAFSGASRAEFEFAESNALANVGAKAFKDCYLLADFIAPSIANIADYAFDGCRTLKTVYIPSHVKLANLFGKVVNDDNSVYFYLNEERYIPVTLKNIYVTEGEKGEIADGSFKNTNIKSAVLLNGVSKVGDYAFAHEGNVSKNNGIFTVEFPATLKAIGTRAFEGRNDIETLRLPAGLESIAEYAFYGLEGLNDVQAEKNSIITYIGRDAFGGTDWYENYVGVAILGRVAVGMSEKMTVQLGKIYLDEEDFVGVSVISPYAFYGNTALQSIVLPNDIYRIYDYAFATCTRLISVTLGADTILGADAEQGSKHYSKIFEGCSSLRRLTLGVNAAVEELFGTNPMPNTTEFKGAYLPDSLQELVLTPTSASTVVESGIYNGLMSVNKIVFGDGITAIIDGAFLNTAFKEAVFASSVVIIGSSDGTTDLYVDKEEDRDDTDDEEDKEDSDEDATGDTTDSDGNGDATDDTTDSDVDGNKEDEIQKPEYIYKGTFPTTLSLISFEEGACIAKICDSAFRYCSLQEVNLPASLRYIGKYAFADNGRPYVDALTFEDTEKLVIGEYAFYGMNFPIAGNYTLILPAGLREIKEYAFASCDGLSYVTFGDGIKIIGNYAFADSGIKGFELPASVKYEKKKDETEIPLTGILKGTILAELVLHTPVTSAVLFDGEAPSTFTKLTVEGNIADHAFDGVKTLGTVELIDVVNIGEYAFNGCSGLTRMAIPASVNNIGDYAFAECSELSAMLFAADSAVKSVGKYCFKNDKKLFSLFLPDTVKNEEFEGVFYGCETLEAVSRLPESVTTIGKETFYNCKKLKALTLSDKIAEIGEKAFYGCAAMEMSTVSFDKLVSIGESAFEGCLRIIGLKAINVETIGDRAFFNCDNLEEITVADKQVNKIANHLLSITSADISKSVNTISADMFAGCANIENIMIFIETNQINDILTNIGEVNVRVFVSQEGRKLISDSNLTLFNGRLFVNPTQMNITYRYDTAQKTATILKIEDYTEEIQSENGGSSLKTVPIGEVVYFPAFTYKENEKTHEDERYTVTAIGREILKDLPQVKQVIIPASVEILGESIFKNSVVTSVRFETGSHLTEIGNEAFRGCAKLTDFRLPDSVTRIGGWAFYESALTSLYASGFSNLVSIGEYAFYGCESLTSVSIQTKTFTEMGEYAFADSGLAEISISADSKFTKIPVGMFSACYSLDKAGLDLPSRIVEIGEEAFSNCMNMTSFDLPSAVTAIGDGAFINCVRLAEINLSDGLSSLGKNVFDGCSSIVFNDYGNASYLGNKKNPHLALIKCGQASECTISESCTIINETAFDESHTLKITVPAGTQSIKYSVHSCESLTEIRFDAVACEDVSEDIGVFLLNGQHEGNISVVIGSGVQRIPANLFCGATKITSVVFDGDSVCESIGEAAFYGCVGISTITLPQSVKSMGTHAFYNCLNLASIVYLAVECEDLSAEDAVFGFDKEGNTAKDISLTVGTSVDRLPAHLFDGIARVAELTFETHGDEGGCTHIGDYAFNGCGKITSLTIPETVEEIGSYAFGGCGKIADLTIPASGSLKKIGGYAFSDCSAVKQITLPTGLTLLGQNAFIGCASVTAIDYRAVNLNDLSDNNGVFNGAGTATGGIAVSVNSCVTRLPKNLFNPNGGNGVPKIKTLSFAADSQCESIGENAFYRIKDLTGISVPGSVATIGAYAFYGCEGVDSFFLTDGLIEIGEAAFGDCSDIKTVTLPSTVESIGKRAFSGCRRITRIYYYAEDCADLGADTDVFAYAGRDGNGIIVNIGVNVTAIPAGLFGAHGITANKITTVTFAQNCKCTSIGDYAFYGCGLLSGINLPATTERIGDYAFAECITLAAVNLGNKVAYIGDYAFNNCSSLEGITVSAATAYIGKYAYYNCIKVQTINYNAVQCNDLERDNAAFTFVGNATSGITLSIDSGVTKIPAYIFSASPNIVTISFKGASSCTSIGAYAFYDCKFLKNIDVPQKVTSIGDSAFYNCVRVTKLYFDAISCNDFSNNNSVFMYCGHSGEGIQLNIGANAMKIPAYAFRSTPKIIGITFAQNCRCESIGDYAFYDCDNVTTVNIPDSVSSIGIYAFCESDNINSVYIGRGIMNIESYAFANSGIAYFTINTNAKIKKIKEYTFINCPNLIGDNIKLPKDTELDKKAFKEVDDEEDGKSNGKGK